MGVIDLSDAKQCSVVADERPLRDGRCPFTVQTPGRAWRLAAPDLDAQKDWVDTIQRHVGLPSAPLVALDTIEAEELIDAHLLTLEVVGSSDQLRRHVRLGFGAGARANGGQRVRAVAASLGDWRHPLYGAEAHVPVTAVAQHVQAAWRRLTTFLGVPVRGRERSDSWLSPRSELGATLLPMRSFDLVWRELPPAPSPSPMAVLSGGPSMSTVPGAVGAASPMAVRPPGMAATTAAASNAGGLVASAAAAWAAAASPRAWLTASLSLEEGLPPTPAQKAANSATPRRLFCVLTPSGSVDVTGGGGSGGGGGSLSAYDGMCSKAVAILRAVAPPRLGRHPWEPLRALPPPQYPPPPPLRLM